MAGMKNNFDWLTFLQFVQERVGKIINRASRLDHIDRLFLYNRYTSV
jgi:hypothetical protein